MANPIVAIGGWSAGEIVVVLAILLLLFGANKLPKLARSLGSSMTEFKKGLRGEPEGEETKKLEDKPADAEPKGKPGETD